MNEQQKRYLQGIKYAGNNLLGLINDILDFSKIESGKIQFNHTPFNLVEVITYVKKTLANASREQRTELDVRMAKTLPENVVGDKTRLGQILLNLLGNGIKFSPGGKVLLEIENESFSKGIYTLKFKVTDNGVGIPREELGRIFESFHQAPSPEILLHGGVGLGLAITKQLIVQQGGEINVESIENEGTTFTFFIPFTSTKVQLESTQSPSSIVASKPKIEKLLLVEDIDLNRELTEDILKHLFPGVEIASAASGQEALDQLDKGFLPDVILMDIRMPEMDGLTCTAHIRKRYDPLMPVFALTASATHPEIQRCWMAGLDGVLPKPFTPQQLVMELDNLLQPDISAESLQVDYDVLVGFLGKDETRVNRYIAAARGEVYRHFQDVRIALAEDNKSQLKVSMHSLKTIFQYLGVTALADLFREAENAIDEASKEKISEIVVKAATHLRVFLFHYRLNVSL